MANSRTQSAIVFAALATTTLAGFANPSLADVPIFRNIEVSGGINEATLTVAQENGQWTRITDHSRQIPVHVKIKMSRGYVVFYRVGRNLTNGAVRDILLTHGGSNSGTLIEAVVDSRQTVSGNLNVFVGGGSRLNPTDEQAIVAGCNAKPGKLGPGHSFSYTLPLAVHADAREKRRRYFPVRYGDTYKPYGDFARGVATGFVTLRIECLGHAKPPAGAGATTKPPSGEPEPGTQLLNVSIRPKSPREACPRPYVMAATIRAPRKSGQQVRYVSYAIEKNDVRGNWTRERMYWDGNSFRLDVKKDFSLDPGSHNVRLILKNGKKSDIIKTPEVTCPQFKVLSAKLQYNVVGGDKCPKQVWETATFTTNAPGEVRFRIVNAGKQQLHTAWVLAKNHGTIYKAVAQRVLTMEAYRGLRGVVAVNNSNDAKPAWTELEVACPALPRHDGGPKGLTGTKKPTHADTTSRPDRIKVAVPPAARPTRVGPGRDRRVSVRCERGFELRGKRCVKTAVPGVARPTRVEPRKDRKVSIRCRPGFKPVQGKCVNVR